MNFQFKTKPYTHQKACLDQFGSSKAFALLAEMGTGKTWIIINNAVQLWGAGEIDAMLVLAPNGVHTNWTDKELPKHAPDNLPMQVLAWSSSRSKRFLRDLEAIMTPTPTRKLRVLAMNHEALQSKRGQEFAQRFVKSGKTMIAVDESDAFKNPAAKRTKALMSLREHSEYRRIMSGTPITNSPFDAFSQFQFLDPNIWGTTSFYAFKAKYAEMLAPNDPRMIAIRTRGNLRFTPQIVASGPDGVPKYRNLDELTAKIAPHSFRVLKEECLDLPDKIYKTITFDLTREQRKLYDLASQEYRLVFRNEETPITKLTAATKLAQITSGYYMHPWSDSPVRIDGPQPRLELLSQRIRSFTDSGQKVVVWARYRVQISDIAARMAKEGIKTVQYHGGVGEEARKRAIDEFENGDAMVFLANAQAGGTGITLVQAACVIYFSNSFSLRERLQSEDRAHRIGQKNNVVYIDLVARDTIDEHIVNTLVSKKSVSDKIVNDGSMLSSGERR